MSNEHQRFWDAKHFETAEMAKISKPSVFVKWASSFFPKAAKILELGAGTGQDTHYLLSHGFTVVATDFSKRVLDFNLQAASVGRNRLTIQELDLTQFFPFANESFGVIFSHLVVHYFDRRTTQEIMDETFRVLKPGGVIALQVNSVTDPEYGRGTKLEEDYFEIAPGIRKRYFSVESMRDFTGSFERLVLDNQGADPRRSHKTGLIRFIGRKV